MFLEGTITAPTVLRAAYARTASASGAFPAIPKPAGPVPSGPLGRLTGPLARLTGPLPELPGYNHRQQTGLAALLALASAAVVSDGHTLDVATEVWRTGAFPAVPADAGGLMPGTHSLTTLDLFGGQPAGAQLTGVEPRRASYRHRQQAGVDALIAIATPVAPEDDGPVGEPRESHSTR
jgi:hypothetical protein